MICIGCITADNSSSGANKLPLMSSGREQCTVWVVVHSHSPSRLSFKQALSFQDNKLRLCCVHLQTDRDTKLPVWHAFVSALYSPVHSCAELLLLSFTSWQAGSQVYTLFSFPLHVSIHVTAGAPCPNSTLSVTVCREGKGGEANEVERKNRLEHFSGVLSFFIWSARSCWTTNQKCAKEKEKTTKHRQELCIPASTRKSPILGQSRQLSLAHLLSFECLCLSADSVVGFINEILMAMFSVHVSDCSARASFSNTMSSRQIWQVELRRQHIEVN